MVVLIIVLIFIRLCFLILGCENFLIVDMIDVICFKLYIDWFNVIGVLFM